MNPSRLLHSSVLLMTAAALTVAGCKRGDATADAAEQQMPPPAVVIAPAVLADVPVYLDEIGKIVSMDSVSIIPQIDGKLIAGYVEDGAEVKKGQLLFEIDPRPFQASLDSSKAALQGAKSNLELANIENKRMLDLKGTQAISQQEMDEAKTTVDVNSSKVSAAQADIETAEVNLSYCKIYSPIDGRAGARLIVPGNVIKKNDAPIMNIQRLDPIYAEFTVTENDLGTVRKYITGHGLALGLTPEKGLKVLVDVPGDSRNIIAALGPLAAATMPAPGVVASPATQPTAGPADSMPSTQPSMHGTAHEGTLTFLDNSVQDGTGTIRIRATLENKDHYFWPGQFVQVRLILTTKKNAVLVPASAEQIGQTGPFLYIVDADSTASMRPITPGQRQGDLLVLEEGVAAGEKVIVTGQMLVMDKGKVMIANAGGPPGAAPTSQPAH